MTETLALAVGAIYVIGEIVRWMRQRRVRHRHHYHNTGPVERAACGQPTLYEWACCGCPKTQRNAMVSTGGFPDGQFARTDYDKIQVWEQRR